jgi:hypothetical protein
MVRRLTMPRGTGINENGSHPSQSIFFYTSESYQCCKALQAMHESASLPAFTSAEKGGSRAWLFRDTNWPAHRWRRIFGRLSFEMRDATSRSWHFSAFLRLSHGLYHHVYNIFFFKNSKCLYCKADSVHSTVKSIQWNHTKGCGVQGVQLSGEGVWEPITNHKGTNWRKAETSVPKH